MYSPMQLVQKLIKKFGTHDPFLLCEYLDIAVLTVPLSGIRGFCQTIKNFHIIYIGDSLATHEQRFVCAHELGHLLMHSTDNAMFLSQTHFVTTKYEVAANRFAVCLLYPYNDTLPDYKSLTSAQLAAQMGVPEQLASYRISIIAKQNENN